MKYISTISSILLALYFVFVHPALIFYLDRHMVSVYPDNRFLYISLTLYIVSLFILSHIAYNYSLGKYQHMQSVLQSGRRELAKLLHSRIKKSVANKWEQREILLHVENFSGEVIQQRLTQVDDKPWEKRFEEKQKVYVRIDDKLKREPVVMIEGAIVRLDYTLIVVFLFIVLGITAYYVYTFVYEGNLKDWNYLVPNHSLVVSSFILFIVSTISYITFIISNYRHKSQQKLLLKWTGKKTIAQIIRIKDTRIKVNKRPLLQFELEYTDHLGKKYLTKY